MASVWKKPGERIKKGTPWRIKYRGADGKWHSAVGVADRNESLRLARHLEDEARLIRAGALDPGARKRKQAELRALADHAADYRAHLVAQGDTAKHADHTLGTIRRVLADAGCETLSDLAPERIQAALARLTVPDRKAKGGRRPASARTRNFARGAVKAFASWLHDAGRLEEVPRGLRKLAKYNEEADRKRIRRALTPEQLEALIAATEAADPIVAKRPGRGKAPSAHLTGPDRAMLYRLAAGTGFRANELRTLTPEAFRLDGDDPAVVVKAAYAKNGREAVQPIRRELADRLRPWLAGKPPGVPVLAVPEKTAKMLAADLERAGIPYETPEGVADLHALRGAFITALIRSGADVAQVQRLARHSTPTLTLNVYAKTNRSDLRRALEGDK